MSTQDNIRSELLAQLEQLNTLKESNPSEYAKQLNEINQLLKEFNKKTKEIIELVDQN